MLSPISSLSLLILLSLATARLVRFLVHDSGPGCIFEIARFHLGLRHDESGQPIYRQGSAQELLVCHWCLSVWVAAALTGLLWYSLLFSWPLMALAASQASSMVLDREV